MESKKQDKAAAQEAPKAAKAEKKGASRKGDKQKAKERRDKARREIAEEMRSLRDALKTSSEAFFTRLDGEIAALADAFDGKTLPEEKPRLPPARVQETLLQAMRTLKVKPAKGRCKDLERIAALVEEIHKAMPPGS